MWLAPVALLHDRGNACVRERVPRALVAEEARDVDQDRVEEVRELLRVHLEEVVIFVVARDPDLVHPLLHAAHEARSLVAREVEPAVVADVVEQRLEAGIDVLGRQR